MHIVPSTAKTSVKNSNAKRPAVPATSRKLMSNDMNATPKYNTTNEMINE
jgi:hypothetical protein